VALTTPNVTPQYAVPFSVTTTVAAVACNTAAPNCYPAGNVTVSVDGVPVGTSALAPGSGQSAAAILSVSSPLAVGKHSITAVYSTDGFYASVTSAAFTVTIGPENTSAKTSASPNPVVQFTPLTLTATVTSVSGKPTGSFSFYAGSVLLGSAGITPSTGVATLLDTQVAATVATPAYYQNFNLAAGTYSITAVYSGDTNYSTSTSAGYSLQVTALPQSFTSILVNPATGAANNLAVTYPGATTQLDLFITPSNTLNGTVRFSCTGMPTYSDCGFSPSTLSFAPTPLFPTPQYTQVTFFTNVNPAVIGPGQAGFNESWLAMGGSIVLLAILRKRARRYRLLLLLPTLVLLVASSALFSGCGSGSSNQNFTTPLGTYNVNIIATGPNGQSISLPATFTVAAATSN
jgi:Bacterial Ig-like domain (group 3)